MNVYMFQAALYCEACGESIIERLTAEGKAPAHPSDEYSFDSDEYPKGPYPDGGGEADSPSHCDCGPYCLNAETIGRLTVGAFLENPLTSDGYNYVRQSGRSKLALLWKKYYL